tara:strand:- start:6817 stop:7035 length:219 start_codon:yes stop_codon:yes gene_type:complete
MYDITEKGEKQYRRVVRLIYGLYILIPLVFLLGCAGLEPIHDYRQDPIKHEDHEDYTNNCKDPLSDDCILVA